MNQKTHCIYQHISPNGKIYIGQAVDVKKRWANGNGYKENKDFYRDIQMYGWDSFEHYILEENLTEKEANVIEALYIILSDCENKEIGYNQTHLKKHYQKLYSGSILPKGIANPNKIKNIDYYENYKYFYEQYTNLQKSFDETVNKCKADSEQQYLYKKEEYEKYIDKINSEIEELKIYKKLFLNSTQLKLDIENNEKEVLCELTNVLKELKSQNTQLMIDNAQLLEKNKQLLNLNTKLEENINKTQKIMDSIKYIAFLTDKLEG